MNDDEMKPRDHAEEVALFRAQVVGDLVARNLDRGELRAELEEKARQRFRPPGSDVTRQYSIPTLQRWYYRLRKGGHDLLRPKLRSDRGAAQSISDELRTFLLDVRREHRSMSAALILDTLVRLGRVAQGAISPNTVRRLYRDHGLSRSSKRHQTPGRKRLRWEAARPGMIWHADVCHGPKLTIDGQKKPLRIHGILDDHSRYVVALVAVHGEREVDMLNVWTQALRRWGKPQTLYLDNGSTYRGDVLRISCERLGVRLVHAEAYDPQARGKMERFWRTLRERCLDHLPANATLHDVQIRLLAFLDEWYHSAPHASLVGATPGQRWGTRELPAVDEHTLRDALVVQGERRVSNDGVVSVGGQLWEVPGTRMAGRKIVIERTLVAPEEAPWLVHDERRTQLTPLQVLDNARRRRPEPPKKRVAIDLLPYFDPMAPLVDAAVGRKPSKGGER